MKKMYDNKDIPISENGNKRASVMILKNKKGKEEIFIKKGKELSKDKKAISMKHIFKEKQNINNNVGINQNMQEDGEKRENSSKPRTDNSIVKGNKMKIKDKH